MTTRIKRIQNPTFTQFDLDTLDPVIKLGEVICLLNGDGTVSKYKIGNGVLKWSELAFIAGSEYNSTDLVTNQIGDILVGSSQLDRSFEDMINDMISPYLPSVVSNVRTNANGVDFAVVSQMEVGQSIGSAISLTFDVANPENLVTIPMIIDTSGVFVEANPYPNAPIAITPVSPLAPLTPTIYEIKVKAEHTNGFSDEVSAFIRFDMRMIWGASSLTDLTTSTHATDLIANGGGQGVIQDYKTDYEISALGYAYVLIPAELLNGQPPVVWTDVSNPNAPSTVEMVYLGTLSVNNGVATYNYEKFRTPFSNLEGSILRAS